jgi:hypothetical protein
VLDCFLIESSVLDTQLMNLTNRLCYHLLRRASIIRSREDSTNRLVLDLAADKK